MTARRATAGAAMVEAAFALPVLFMFVFAMIDLGLWGMYTNQAESAARDGARAGILVFHHADIPAAADREAVVDAALRRLPEGTARREDVVISCLDPDDVPRPCSTARLDIDRIHVEIRWRWPLLTPVAGLLGRSEGFAAGSASMVIVGLPTAGPEPTPATEVEP